MSLRFDYSECDDVALTDEQYAHDCEFVVFNTMFCGMPNITETNYVRFAMRITMLNAALGYDSDFHKILDRVRPWIGLRTNASNITDAEFWKKIRRNADERIENVMRIELTESKVDKQNGN